MNSSYRLISEEPVDPFYYYEPGWLPTPSFDIRESEYRVGHTSRQDDQNPTVTTHEDGATDNLVSEGPPQHDKHRRSLIFDYPASAPPLDPASRPPSPMARLSPVRSIYSIPNFHCVCASCCAPVQDSISGYVSPPATPKDPIPTPEYHPSSSFVETQATSRSWEISLGCSAGSNDASHSTTESNPFADFMNKIKQRYGSKSFRYNEIADLLEAYYKKQQSIIEVYQQIGVLLANGQDLLEEAQRLLLPVDDKVPGATSKGKSKRKFTIAHSPDGEGNKRARLWELPEQLPDMPLNDSTNRAARTSIQHARPVNETLSRQMVSSRVQNARNASQPQRI